ncbi:MAG: AAA family ATPase [Candidatus Poribacteria bacterium]
MAVITISREHGSGGAEIGRRVAKILGYDYIDKELITEVAKMANVPESGVEKLDEKGEDPIIYFLKELFVEDEPQTVSEYPNEYDDDESKEIQKKKEINTFDRDKQLKLFQSVIESVWERDNAVIIGRKANVILAYKPNTLRVRIIAPLEKRLKRVMRLEHLSQDDALRLIRETDGHRERYAKQYYDVDWDNPRLYDIIINTEKLSNEDAARLITEAAKRFT